MCKVAPALATGCTMVLKPSEVAPFSAAIVAEIFDAAGVPAGVFNLVNGDGPGVGTALAAHPGIDMVSFTGSTRAGIEVAKNAAPTVKRVAQELGGKSPNIILDDEDFAANVAGGVAAMMMNSGQSCNAPTRMLVPAARMAEAEEAARAAAAHGADFAGLVRTEFLFLGRPDAPSVDEQVAVYRKIAEALDGRRVTLRTLDVGGDKPLEFAPGPAELNPFLGVRGIRMSLQHPQLLSDQLLAMALVAQHTPVSVMFPMVSTLDELLAARQLLDDAVTKAGPAPAGLQVGIMVEVPAAALKSAALAPHVDFMSIGTNDLTQYALAADRGNDAVATIGDSYDPGLLALIRATCAGAQGRASVSVCGEFAADERAAGLLIGLGVDALSVTPPAVPAVKEAVRAVDRAAARELAVRAVAAESADGVRELLG
ncbi:aldehyde dehydrogenase family protein, partial [Mycolicibacterium poriferae]|uniref:aldehyde dehydrogenase family protein n=1 Tax=Mycolicibacterium poriferae TaxID=39694 RepID=UPI00321A8F04